MVIAFHCCRVWADLIYTYLKLEWPFCHWKKPCFGGLKPQNWGETGSRYNEYSWQRGALMIFIHSNKASCAQVSQGDEKHHDTYNGMLCVRDAYGTCVAGYAQCNRYHAARCSCPPNTNPTASKSNGPSKAWEIVKKCAKLQLDSSIFLLHPHSGPTAPTACQ